MTTDNDLYVRSLADVALGRERFLRLARALLMERIAAAPWQLIEGPFSRTSLMVPLDIATTEKKPLASGKDLASLEKALATLPYGTADLALHFAGLDTANKAVAKDMKHYHYHDGDVLLVSLRKPMTIAVCGVLDEHTGEDEDDEDEDLIDDEDEDREPFELQDAFIITGTGAPLWDDLDRRSLLARFWKEHFGELQFGENLV